MAGKEPEKEIVLFSRFADNEKVKEEAGKLGFSKEAGNMRFAREHTAYAIDVSSKSRAEIAALKKEPGLKPFIGKKAEELAAADRAERDAKRAEQGLDKKAPKADKAPVAEAPAKRGRIEIPTESFPVYTTPASQVDMKALAAANDLPKPIWNADERRFYVHGFADRKAAETLFKPFTNAAAKKAWEKEGELRAAATKDAVATKEVARSVVAADQAKIEAEKGIVTVHAFPGDEAAKTRLKELAAEGGDKAYYGGAKVQAWVVKTTDAARYAEFTTDEAKAAWVANAPAKKDTPSITPEMRAEENKAQKAFMDRVFAQGLRLPRGNQEALDEAQTYLMAATPQQLQKAYATTKEHLNKLSDKELEIQAQNSGFSKAELQQKTFGERKSLAGGVGLVGADFGAFQQLSAGKAMIGTVMNMKNATRDNPRSADKAQGAEKAHFERRTASKMPTVGEPSQDKAPVAERPKTVAKEKAVGLSLMTMRAMQGRGQGR